MFYLGHIFSFVQIINTRKSLEKINTTLSISSPLALKNGSTLKNRLAKSAMSEAMGDSFGQPKSELQILYRTWATSGLGLCITGNVMVDKRALGEPGNVVIDSSSSLPEFEAWAKAATEHGTACWVQLNHPGKQAPKGLNKETVSPSAVPFHPTMQRFFSTPRALTHEEIMDLIAAFGYAAGFVKKAGFSGVQIHGAHGYLVSQFLSPHHNQRTDEWGGSAEKRRRFVLAIYEAMRKEVGDDFPIGIKLNSADFQKGGFTKEESLDTMVALEKAGIDLIEISGGTYESPAMMGGGEMKKSTREREAYFLDFAENARKTIAVPLMLTGGFRTYSGMNEAVASHAVDLVGMGRLACIEPMVSERLLRGENPREEIRPVKTGIGFIDKMGMLDTVWFRIQLEKIAKNQATDPNLSGLRVLGMLIWRLIRMPSSLRKERAS